MSDESRDKAKPGDRMTVAEAARVLGISEGAVRKRVERGKLQAEHTSGGRLIVYLDTSATIHDRVRDESRDTTTERYVRSLEDQVEYLRDQLAQECDANRENRRIIAALTARIPEIEAPVPQAPSSTSEAHPRAPTEATEQPGRVGPQPEVEGARGEESSPSEPAEPQSWWRRVFGGD